MHQPTAPAGACILRRSIMKTNRRALHKALKELVHVANGKARLPVLNHVLMEVFIFPGVPLEIDTKGRACGSRPGKAEYDSALIAEHNANALVLGLAAIHGVSIVKIVRKLNVDL